MKYHFFSFIIFIIFCFPNASIAQQKNLENKSAGGCFYAEIHAYCFHTYNLNCADSVVGWDSIYISYPDTIDLLATLYGLDCWGPGHAVWFKDGLPIDSPSIHLQITETGVYSVLAYPTGAATPEGGMPIYIFNTTVNTSVGSYPTDDTIKVLTYENEITLQGIEKLNNFYITIYDLDGRVVYDKYVTGKQTSMHLEAGSNLTGIFILAIKNDNHFVRQKIVLH